MRTMHTTFKGKEAENKRKVKKKENKGMTK